MEYPLMTIPEKLANVVSQMEKGDFTPSSEAVLLTRDLETGIITIVRMGDETDLLRDAYDMKYGEEEEI